MQITGACHCGNVSYLLDWPGPADGIRARECGCTFCRKHGGAWTSHREARLEVDVADEDLVSKYRFGTATADFHVCARCGAVPFVTSEIDSRLYAVVNVNTFENVAPQSLSRATTDFAGEDTAGRLQRRERNWIPNVDLSTSTA